MGQPAPKSDKELIKFRKSFIEFYKQVGDVTLTCKTFGLSRPTFYKWYKRYDPNSPETLLDESKAPKTRKKMPVSLGSFNSPQSQMTTEVTPEAQSQHTRGSAEPREAMPVQPFDQTSKQPSDSSGHTNENTQNPVSIPPHVPPQSQVIPPYNAAPVARHPLASIYGSGGMTPQAPVNQPQNPMSYAPYAQQAQRGEQSYQPQDQSMYPTISTLLKTRHAGHFQEGYAENQQLKEHPYPPIAFDQTVRVHKPSIRPSPYEETKPQHQERRIEENTNPYTTNTNPTPSYQSYDRNERNQTETQSTRQYPPQTHTSAPHENDDQFNRNYERREPKREFAQTIEPLPPKRETRLPSANVARIMKTFSTGVQSISTGNKFRGGKNGILFLGITVAIAAAILPSVYFYSKMNTNSPSAQTSDNPSTSDIVAKVGKFMDLPRDEEPTVATVTDLEKLQGQPFFAKAKKGDVVLIYDKAARIILYDPVANKIINAASTNIETPTPTVPPVVEKAMYRVAILNGTDVTGLTRSVEKELLEKVQKVEIATRDNAKKKGYEKTIAIDLTGGTAKDMTNKVAVALGGAVSTLPEGEIAPPLPTDVPPADIMIIIGKDYVQ